jgi:hypothetical protein
MAKSLKRLEELFGRELVAALLNFGLKGGELLREMRRADKKRGREDLSREVEEVGHARDHVLSLTKRGGIKCEGRWRRRGKCLDFSVARKKTGVNQRIGRNRGCHRCKGTRVEQYVSWWNGAEDFEGIQKQRSTQESHAVEGKCRRCSKMKTKDCTAVRVAFASSKRETNSTRRRAWCCEGMGRGEAGQPRCWTRGKLVEREGGSLLMM